MRCANCGAELAEGVCLVGGLDSLYLCQCGVAMVQLSPESTSKIIQVSDDGEKFYDRYTVQIGEDVYTMSAKQSPQDVCMYAGVVDDITYDAATVWVAWSEVPQAVRRKALGIAVERV